MMWILTVLAAAWVGNLLAKALVRRRPVFTYECRNCGEYITVIDMSLVAEACPSCGSLKRRIYDETQTRIHDAGRKRVESKMQLVAIIAAGTLAGFLYGFLF